MAEGGVPENAGNISENLEEQEMELEVLQSIFEADNDRLEILSKYITNDDEGEDSMYTSNMLKLYVPVHTDETPIHVDVCQPVTMETDHQGANDPKLMLARSESGHRIIWSFETRFMTPICLHVTLPPTYPSHDAPMFVMSCDWLSPNQMTALCQQLDQLWQDNKPDDSPGMQILYIWVNWLQENTLRFLGVERQLMVAVQTLDEEVDDCRVVTDSVNIEQIVQTMMRYSRDMERKEFFQGHHECGICFDELPGEDFILLSECGHHVCKECMKGHCQHIVSEGSIQTLLCPLYGCKTHIPQYVLQMLLTKQEFAHYEELALQKGLNMMMDITWCPRCHSVVIREPEEDLNLGRCAYCFYNFCTECQEKWHQGESCFREAEDTAKDTAEKEKLAIQTADLVREKKQREENFESMAYIKSMTKQCPSCRASVMKTFGCNKVICGACNKGMCWVCMKAISGYEHFSDNSKCRTFTEQDERMVDNTDIRQPPSYRRPPVIPKTPTKSIEIERRLKERPELIDRVMRCKSCKCKNIKDDNCNLIRCWNCKTALCFQCQAKIVGPVGKHYTGTSPCQQHSLS